MKQVRELILFLISLAIVWGHAVAQNSTVHTYHTNNHIHIDGKLDEADWSKAQPVSNFWMNYPFDTLPASAQTEVRILCDKQTLYIGAICHNTKEVQKYVVQSLKRDFEFDENEAFSIVINAFKDANTGFSFSVNPYGVQRDGIVADGGLKGVTTSWDGMWHAEVQRNAQYWSVEMAIPIKTLRFKENTNNWRINFARNDQSNNEISTWIPVPRAFETSSLLNTGALIWSNPPTAGTNATVIPYVAGLHSKDFQNDTKKIWPSAGVDAKIALNSSLYFDLTVNPNFSQVEVDQQVINLNRFELFFPEKRIFFLENSDLFSSFGNRRIRPFFSRRIGGADNEPVPIHFGARVTGKLDQKWRLGLMTIQTALEQDSTHGSNNYSVVSLQRTLFEGSTLTGFVANRQQFDDFKPHDDFNLVSGLEFEFRSNDSKWTGEAFLHLSQTNEHLKDAMAYSVKARYKTSKATIRLAVDAAGENFITDMGFVPRLYHDNELEDTTHRIAYTEWRSTGYYRFYLKENNTIDYISPGFRYNVYTGNGFKYQEHEGELELKAQFMNSASLQLRYLNNSPILYFPFTLSGFDIPFPVGNYPGQSIELEYNTGKRRNIFGLAQIGYGKRFMGKGLNIEGELNYRVSPHLVLGSTFSQKYLSEFPEDYGDAQFTLIGPKVEISFSRDLFLTTYLQYNTQADNININSRFQWRFRPLSDLYLVYTENYFPDSADVKNRAIVLKMIYWWGL